MKKSTLEIPVEDNIDTRDLIRCGFRQPMISIGNEGEEESGGLDCGAGLGSDWLTLSWRGRKARIRGRDIFKAWVATFAPDDAERMP